MENDFFYKLLEDKRFYLLIGTITVIVFGILPYVIGFKAILSSYKAINWEESTAIVQSSTVESNNSGISNKGVKSSTKRYKANVVYNYTWRNENFEGERIAFGYKSGTNIGEHAEIQEKLEIGKTVKIKINPNEPSETTIVSGPVKALNYYIAIILGFIVIWMGLALYQKNFSSYRGLSKVLSQLFFVLTMAVTIHGITNFNAPDLVEKIEIID